MHPQVPAEQRTQHLWCGECFVSERLDLDDVPEELGWHEGRCPDCAEVDGTPWWQERVPARRSATQ